LQLTLFNEAASEYTPCPKQKPTSTVFCDVFVSSILDEKKQRIRIRPLPTSTVSADWFVQCSHKARKSFPVGTVFKIDARLVRGKKGRPFLIARAGKPLLRAIEYFDHNLSLQAAGRCAQLCPA